MKQNLNTKKTNTINFLNSQLDKEQINIVSDSINVNSKNDQKETIICEKIENNNIIIDGNFEIQIEHINQIENNIFVENCDEYVKVSSEPITVGNITYNNICKDITKLENKINNKDLYYTLEEVESKINNTKLESKILHTGYTINKIANTIFLFIKNRSELVDIELQQWKPTIDLKIRLASSATGDQTIYIKNGKITWQNYAVKGGVTGDVYIWWEI